MKTPVRLAIVEAYLVGTGGNGNMRRFLGRLFLERTQGDWLNGVLTEHMPEGMSAARLEIRSGRAEIEVADISLFVLDKVHEDRVDGDKS